MAKKNFSAALNAGVQRDKELRDTSIASRFERVEAALDGRATLLETASDESPIRAVAPNTYVETLERDGKITAIYAMWPIDKIDDNPLNSRTIYQEEKISARAASMAKDGQLVPALAARHPSDNTRTILIDGHYRKQGALRNRGTTLDLKILDGLAPIDFYRLARAANNEREQETVLDVALGYKKLLDEGYAKTNDELALLVEEGKSKVSKTLAVLELPTSVQEFIALYPEQFGLNISYELSQFLKATDEPKTRELAQKIVDEGLSFLKVKAIREGLSQGRAPRKTFSRQYKISSPEGASIGAIKEWGNGNIQVSLALDNPERAEVYIEALKKLLDEDGHKAH
ncbi:ParB/RepB/Spo0J family partition protein [Paraburkholderia tagetis]|uniref:ParB/RepB/Spo0J family partition protein n=1 Tax=Paraburkholderia tagetis TaxID=2913261 RepID=A0A9X1RW09_9BURK|nr:ParB/RepB/Spo0J family partition protein [Paraburkholderia tagetis]MCG5077112.1 ParB/RepB/Spo0J family partition protein [Paraburkholderia tagetis]